jgi:hypothetical protein
VDAKKPDVDKKDEKKEPEKKDADTKDAKKDGDKKAEPKKNDTKKADAKGKKEAEAAPPSKAAPVVNEVASERARLEAEFFRRSAACLKLQEIAARTNDAALQQQADLLSEKAWTAFSQRSAGLPSNGGHFDSDEGVLEKYLGEDKDVKLPKTESAAHTVPGKEASGHAAVKEDKP